MSVCVSVCVSHHILIWVHMFWHLTYVLKRCHVTDINHVLTRCHVTEINYVDRGAAARAPLQCDYDGMYHIRVLVSSWWLFFSWQQSNLASPWPHLRWWAPREAPWLSHTTGASLTLLVAQGLVCGVNGPSECCALRDNLQRSHDELNRSRARVVCSPILPMSIWLFVKINISTRTLIYLEYCLSSSNIVVACALLFVRSLYCIDIALWPRASVWGRKSWKYGAALVTLLLCMVIEIYTNQRIF